MQAEIRIFQCARAWRLPRLLLWACLLLLCLFPWSHRATAVEPPKRILMISAYSDALPATVRASVAIKKRFDEVSPDHIEIFYDALDLGRFPGKAHEDRMARFLAEKYSEKHLDLIIALSREALRYLLQYRDAFAPGIPIVFCCMTGSAAFGMASSPDVTGVISDYDWQKTLALATHLQPNARDIVLISGASDYDRQWREEAEGNLAPYLQKYNVRHLAGLPYDALLQEVARLPRDTIVLLLPVFMDGSGHKRTPRQVAADIVKASNAPVYAPYDTFFGLGIVGGYMDSFENSGSAVADLALQVLARKVDQTMPPPMKTPHRYRVDARQLQHWGLWESRLPPGTEIVFQEPTLWEAHPNAVLATIGVFTTLVLILGAMSAQVIRRQRAEGRLKEGEERMAFTAASTNTGLWQYDIATRQLWATEHCRTMFGVSADAPLTPAGLLRTVHPSDRSIVAGAIRSAMRGDQQDGRHEFRVCCPDGKTRWLLSMGHIHFDQEDRPTRVSGVLRDVTDRRIAEEETQRLSQQLLTIQDEERQRIAQALHNSTAQHLAGMCLNMMSLKARAGADAEMCKLCDDIESSLEEASRELRTFTYLLHPPELHMNGLRSSLSRFVDGFAARTGLKIKLSVSRKVDALPVVAARVAAARGARGAGQCTSPRLGLTNRDHAQVRARRCAPGGQRRRQRLQGPVQARGRRSASHGPRHPRHDCALAPAGRRS